MSSVYERDYMTPAAALRRTRARSARRPSSTRTSQRCRSRCGGRREPRLREGGRAPRRHQAPAEPRARAAAAGAEGLTPRAVAHRRLAEEGGARSAGIRPARAARRFAASFTPPFYRHDIVEQFDVDRRRLADGRAADRVLHRRGARAAERPDARSVRRAAGRRPAGQRVDDQGARARC